LIRQISALGFAFTTICVWSRNALAVGALRGRFRKFRRAD
jgi:hypothetical protein